ncbi:MAG: DsbC family protein [Candidatus Parcubacteria bacterium]|nr:DsbC family protein [Burkholderiales bacterium]
MLRRLLGLPSAILILLAVPATPALADEVSELRARLQANMPDVRLGEIRRMPWGLYEVVANGFSVFYADAKGEVGFFGRAIELKTKSDLSQLRLAELRRVDFSQLPLDKAILKVKGKGTRKLAVFADPDCPFCREMEPALDALEDVTIYTFLLPLPSIHPDAMRKATLIWCAPDRSKAWDDWMLRGKLPENGNLGCATPILEVAQLAKRLNIEGTPGLVFSDGELVPGALSKGELDSRLAVKARGS